MDFGKELAHHTPENWVKDETACSDRLKDESVWNSIPLINVASTQYLKDSALVRFRGMIQDMYDPEYYYEKYEIIHKETEEKRLKNGKYSDTAQWGENEEFAANSCKNVLNERQTFVVITAPGKNVWVENIEKEQFKIKASTEEIPPQTSSVKRSHEEENMETDEIPSATKKTHKNPAETANSPTISVDSLLNFPLPGSCGKVCHLKLYDNFDDLKLNDLCEFVGFVSLDPILSHESYHNGEFENEVEVQTHNPPPSLVPRIHCVAWKKLTHNNPLLQGAEKFSPEKMAFLKGELLVVLTQILLGDRLAAEYLLYHLISSVYVRKDFLALGKFCLNISNIPLPQNIDIPKELYKFLELFVPQSYYFPMTLENMNDLTFTPKKDHESNRLISGILQLNNNTHLVLDETKLQAGKLNESGVRGVAALANAAQAQMVRYDFGFNITQEFNCDIPFLILSEGKSMLPSDFHVKLEADETCLNTFNEITEAARHFLKPELLNDIRIFLTLARFGDYNLPETVQNKIQEEFVAMRQNSKTTADDLHQLLVLTRLICLSEGKNLLNDECWKKACTLEMERKSRLVK